MQLVDHEIVRRDAPTVVPPPERIGVDDFRRPVHAVRLESRRRVGAPGAVDHVCVAVAGTRAGNEALLHPLAGRFQRMDAGGGSALDLEVEIARRRGKRAEANAVAFRQGAEQSGPGGFRRVARSRIDVGTHQHRISMTPRVGRGTYSPRMIPRMAVSGIRTQSGRLLSS